MTPAEALLFALGFLTVGVGLVDIVLTVLHYEGYGPLSKRVYRVTWRLYRAIALRLPLRRRRHVLSFGGPLLVVTGIAVWILLVLAGFALVYSSALDTGLVAPGGRPLTFVDAVYFSGASLSTVGYGDIYAVEPLFQVVSVFEALVGFSLLTLAIAYILGVYGVVREQSMLAALVDDQTNGSADPLDLAAVWLAAPSTDTHWSSLHRQLLALDEGLHRYPIVYYFRRSPAHRSLPYTAAMIGEAAAAVRWCLPRGDSRASSSSLATLINGLSRMIDEMGERFVAQMPDDARRQPGEEELRRRYNDASQRLAKGTQAMADTTDDRYEGWRQLVAAVDRFVSSSARDLAYGTAEGIPDRP